MWQGGRIPPTAATAVGPASQHSRFDSTFQSRVEPSVEPGLSGSRRASTGWNMNNHEVGVSQ